MIRARAAMTCALRDMYPDAGVILTIKSAANIMMKKVMTTPAYSHMRT